MEISSSVFFEYSYSSSPFLYFVAILVTVSCCFFAHSFSLRSKSKSPESKKVDNCSCNCNRSEEISEIPKLKDFNMVERVPAERQSGASMMEQLVPEITTHALSYLDYPSLCRLSMTNSLMRKAANDDNAWKALYHKDFTLEQDSVTPVNGWKAYYAATRAIVNVNNEFFRIIRDKALAEMGRFWLNTDYVKCFHAFGEFYTGYGAVMQSWQLAFNWDQGFNFDIQDVRVRVLADVAWVTMKGYLVDMEAGAFHMTNVSNFTMEDGTWSIIIARWCRTEEGESSK